MSSKTADNKVVIVLGWFSLVGVSEDEDLGEEGGRRVWISDGEYHPEQILTTVSEYQMKPVTASFFPSHSRKPRTSLRLIPTATDNTGTQPSL